MTILINVWQGLERLEITGAKFPKIFVNMEDISILVILNLFVPERKECKLK